MSNFKETVLTTKGNNLLLKVLTSQCELEFTRIVVGDGIQTLEDYREVTELVSEKMESNITNYRVVGDGSCYITGRFSNENIEELIMVRELGVYAIDPEEGEVLYAYTTSSENANYFAPSSTTVLVEEYSLYTFISSVSDIKANIVGVTNATEVDFDNAGSNITSDKVDGALRELDGRLKPNNSLVNIKHNLGYYPNVLALEVNRGAGKGAVGDVIDCSGVSVFARIRYLSVNEIEILVSDELKFSEAVLTKVTNNNYIVNFSDTDKSIEIILR